MSQKIVAESSFGEGGVVSLLEDLSDTPLDAVRASSSLRLRNALERIVGQKAKGVSVAAFNASL